MSTQPTDKQIPYSKLMTMYEELQEENAWLRAGLDHLQEEVIHNGRIVDALLDVVVSLKGKTDLPF